VKAQQLTDPITFHGEGAVWFPGVGLKCVDMLAGDVLSFGFDGSISRLATGSPVAAVVRPRQGGGQLIVTEREFTLWSEAGEREWASESLLPADGSLRFNEGGCDPLGRMLCGSMAYSAEEGAGSVFRLDADRSTSLVFDGTSISNGLGFTADGSQMYYVDTPTGRVDVFDFVDGELRDRRPFVSIPEEIGQPDGLWVDAENGVWVALYGGSAVRHYDASGNLADVVELPVTNVTSCTLGGDDLSTLFITTSRENLADGEQPLAGALFTLEVGVRGLPALPFAG
jgi:sugar lactone lactonase YvrE